MGGLFDSSQINTGELYNAAAFIGLSLLVLMVHHFVHGQLSRNKRAGVILVIGQPARRVVVWGLLFIGLRHLIHSFSILDADYGEVLQRALEVGWVLLLFAQAALAITDLLNIGFGRYAPADKQDAAMRLRLVSNLVNAVLFTLAILYGLRISGLDITPLLAGGAVGGLAIGLALQDTLGNLFAGYWLLIDRPIRVGDMVRLDSGTQGSVQDIGWRTTKLLAPEGNLVVIPNSVLIKTSITNFEMPSSGATISIPFLVGYEADPSKVEKVVQDVMQQVGEQLEPGAARTGTVRWKEFADNGVRVIAILPVSSFAEQFVVQSEFIKELHRRFGEEGIAIPHTLYPTQPPSETKAAKPSADSPHR